MKMLVAQVLAALSPDDPHLFDSEIFDLVGWLVVDRALQPDPDTGIHRTKLQNWEDEARLNRCFAPPSSVNG
jgi:hypothetical protein